MAYWAPPDRDALLSRQRPHTSVHGWDAGKDAAGELIFFRSASRTNLKANAADFAQCFSALSQWRTPVPLQPNHFTGKPVPSEHVHCVALVMSDGDNLQWLINTFCNDPRWYASLHRGKFTMNWDLSPELLEVAPLVLKYIYENASTGNERDYFVTAHGPGTDYPSDVQDLAGSVEVTAQSMRRADQRVLSILDNRWDPKAFAEILSPEEVLGAMYKSNDGGGYALESGRVSWHGAKPIVSVTHTLWEGHGDPDPIASAINAAPAMPLTDQASYSVVNVHPWSSHVEGDPMSNAYRLVQRLAPHVRVVTLDEFMVRLRENFGRPLPRLRATKASGADRGNG